MSTTRLLVLGCLRLFQPTHGYTIERELRSWNAEQWSGLNYGSVYYTLRQMTKEGFLETVGESEQGPGGKGGRTTYQLTRVGEEEFQRLLRVQAWATDPPIDPFAVVMGFAESLPREEFIRVLRFRVSWASNLLESLEATARDYEVSDQPVDGKPWVVPEQLRIMAEHLRAVRDSATDLLGRYEDGCVPHPETSPKL